MQSGVLRHEGPRLCEIEAARKRQSHDNPQERAELVSVLKDDVFTET